RHGLAAIGAPASDAEAWRPWRSYALHQLWLGPPPAEETATRQPSEAPDGRASGSPGPATLNNPAPFGLSPGTNGLTPGTHPGTDLERNDR
ncbi:hypothetical protein QMK28_27375, partial [Streptomyces sp. H27-D2]|nr:hypothetical protein [Streptomyces sp. H27-D2]